MLFRGSYCNREKSRCTLNCVFITASIVIIYNKLATDSLFTCTYHNLWHADKFNSICTHTRGQTFKDNPRRRVITDLQPVYVTNLMVIPNTSLISIRRSKKDRTFSYLQLPSCKGKRAIKLQTWVGLLWFCSSTSHQRKLFTSVLLRWSRFLFEGHSNQEAKTCSLKRTPCQVTDLESPRSDDCCMLGPLSLCQPNIPRLQRLQIKNALHE